MFKNGLLNPFNYGGKIKGEGVLKGYFRNGKPIQAEVELTYEDNSTYKGKFSDGFPSEGKLEMANGDSYEGQFKEGKYDG